MSSHFQIAIIGGGIVGLATGRELTSRFPGVRLVVIEKAYGGRDSRNTEPHAAGIRGIHVPGTSIVDYGRVAEKLGDLITRNG
jgi:L-2-hydroxyglutarate oxidase LhgO